MGKLTFGFLDPSRKCLLRLPKRDFFTVDAESFA